MRSAAVHPGPQSPRETSPGAFAGASSPRPGWPEGPVHTPARAHGKTRGSREGRLLLLLLHFKEHCQSEGPPDSGNDTPMPLPTRPAREHSTEHPGIVSIANSVIFPVGHCFSPGSTVRARGESTLRQQPGFDCGSDSFTQQRHYFTQIAVQCENQCREVARLQIQATRFP